MLVSKTSQGNWINVSFNRDHAQLRKLRKAERFFCPECQEEVILKIGTKRMTHFAHQKGSVCTESYERESEYHLQGKLQLFKWLQSQGVDPILEEYEQAISQRPDISFVYNGIKYVIEYQCSPIPIELFLKRTFTYLKANIMPIWILGGKHISRKGFSIASLSSFDYLFLRKTTSQQWFLQAFCPITNHLITMKNITPISIKNVLTQFSVSPLHNVMLDDLLLPSEYKALSLTSWFKEMRKWKNTVALYGTANNIYLQELYSNGFIPSFLPPAIGLPVVHLPFIETPPTQWQSYIYLDMLKQEKPITLDEIIQLFNKRIHRQEVKIRKLSLIPKNDYKTAVKEYINILVATKLIQRVHENRYQMIDPIVIGKNQIEQEQLERDFFHKYREVIIQSLRISHSPFGHR